MRIEELSIGDWVMSDDFIFKVIGIEKWRPDYVVILEGEESVETWGVKCIAPIPITPKILEKNGFEKEEDKYGNKRYSLIEGGTKFSLGYARSVFQWTFPIDVRYVHQLQHLLRFCGVEKEIEV